MLSNEEQEQLLDMNLETFQEMVEDRLLEHQMNQILKDVRKRDFEDFISDLYDDGYSVTDAAEDVVYEYRDKYM